MKLLRDKTFNRIVDKSFEAGLEVGYRLAYQIASKSGMLPHFERTNVILNSKLSTSILRDLEELGRGL